MRVCVCLPPRLLITSDMILTSYNWLNKFYYCYMAVSLLGMTFALICVVETNPLRVSWHCIRY